VTVNAVAPRARTRMTETMSMDMSAKEGVFDAWSPKNIANVVGFLAAPESADISGQIFVVYGGNVHVMSAFKPIGAVTRDAEWTPAELVAAKGELFKDIGSEIPPFSVV
jgi:hypothetical protein